MTSIEAHVPSAPPSTRRERVAWYFYDWASSAMTVVTVFFGPYLTSIARAAADAEGLVHPLGIPVAVGAFFPYVISLSVLVQVLCLPVLGAIADYSHRKKQWLAMAAVTGAIATTALFHVQGTAYLLGGALFLIASVSFQASVVFSNAFLPDLATAEQRDSVSINGWAFGYLGGGSLLALNLLLFSRAPALGLSQGEAVRISLGSAGLWWGAFTLIPILQLRNRQPVRRLARGEHYLTAGFTQLRSTIGKARAYPQTLLFLVAFLIYNDGVQTIITLSSQFGQEELGLPIATLTTVVLIVQFVGYPGTLLFKYVARAVGSRRTIILTLCVWAAVVGYAYGFLQTERDFYLLGVVLGLVFGATQALSRSVFSLMIPRGREAEYFGLYVVSDRGTSWLGPLLFGLALQITGSYRVSLLPITAFFLVGIALLLFVDVRRAAIEAGNEPPRRG